MNHHRIVLLINAIVWSLDLQQYLASSGRNIETITLLIRLWLIADVASYCKTAAFWTAWLLIRLHPFRLNKSDSFLSLQVLRIPLTVALVGGPGDEKLALLLHYLLWVRCWNLLPQRWCYWPGSTSVVHSRTRFGHWLPWDAWASLNEWVNSGWMVPAKLAMAMLGMLLGQGFTVLSLWVCTRPPFQDVSVPCTPSGSGKGCLRGWCSPAIPAATTNPDVINLIDWSHLKLVITTATPDLSCPCPLARIGLAPHSVHGPAKNRGILGLASALLWGHCWTTCIERKIHVI